MNQYLVLTAPANVLAAKAIKAIGQLMVAPFFFYSGYGIVASYQTKKDYDRSFAHRRILKTWLHFAVAVALYCALGVLMGAHLEPKHTLLAFTGWTSVGNSNWFVNDTLILYLVTYVTFILLRLFRLRSQQWKTSVYVALCFATTVALVYVLSKVQPTRWYNTLLAYPFGSAYRLVQPHIDRGLGRHGGLYWLAIAALGIAFVALYPVRLEDQRLWYNLLSCVFCLGITMVTMKLKVSNPVLAWLGKYSFFTYIYMRIPMNVMRYLGLSAHLRLFVVVSIAATIALAYVMKKIQDRIDRVVL